MEIDKSKIVGNKRLLVIVGVIIIAIFFAIFLVVKNNNSVEKGSSNQEINSGEEHQNSEDKNDPNDNENADEQNVNMQEETIDVSYEKWLAAGVITGISMYYTNFEIKNVYLASTSEFNNKSDSKGVYVVFTVNGEEQIIHSVPLEKERDDEGTIDLSTRNFGYATFDVVKLKKSKLKKYSEIEFDDLNTLISQLMLVTLYEH